MRDAWRRSRGGGAGPWALLGAMGLFASIAAEGCDSRNHVASSSSSGTTGDQATSSSSGVGGSPGSSTGTGVVALTLTLVASAPIVFDATPDPKGTMVYFTAIGDDGPAVYAAPTDGSMQQPKVLLASGAPLIAPFGIAISGDGEQLFVADPGAGNANDRGAIFALPAAGGTPKLLAGSEDMIPRGLEVTHEKSGDFVYFSGTNRASGKPGVFKLKRGGGIATAVFEGPPLRDPSGIAVAKNGDIYVADTIGAASRAASIIMVHAGQASAIDAGLTVDLRVGYPTGVALTLGDQQLYVSAISRGTLTDVIAMIDLVDQSTMFFSTNINHEKESAGLHRAKDAQVFAWADSAGPVGGQVWVLR